jgi:hypothetical protein
VSTFSLASIAPPSPSGAVVACERATAALHLQTLERVQNRLMGHNRIRLCLSLAVMHGSVESHDDHGPYICGATCSCLNDYAVADRCPKGLNR